MAPDAGCTVIVFRGLCRQAQTRREGCAWSASGARGCDLARRDQSARVCGWTRGGRRQSACLTEVAGLVEWPVVLMGEIGAKPFLDLPPEVLQTSMKRAPEVFLCAQPGDRAGLSGSLPWPTARQPIRAQRSLRANGKVLSARLVGCQVLLGERPARGKKRTWAILGCKQALKTVTFEHNKPRVRRRPDGADHPDQVACDRNRADAVGADA
jgi:glycyl-tRNA synthetase beta chain